ncbi:hypothetical protein ACMT4L_15515 [Deinococcus sp. A31D244]|uniref:hypothetical protein n=1 Tax=Deinococcus sp. A31D244 TaxID=3397675 RepID=UPI0039E14ED4
MTVVTDLSAARVPVGVTGAGEWMYLVREGGWSALTDSSPIFLVTVLPQGAAFHADLRDRLITVGLDPSLADTFPVYLSVRLGLTSHSEFWQQGALDWLEREGGTEAFVPELEVLVKTGRTQRICHTARRLVREARSQRSE